MRTLLIMASAFILVGCSDFINPDNEPKCIRSQTAIIPAVRCDKTSNFTGSNYICYESTKRIQQCMEYAEDKK